MLMTARQKTLRIGHSIRIFEETNQVTMRNRTFITAIFCGITALSFGQFGYTEPSSNAKDSEYKFTKMAHLDARLFAVTFTLANASNEIAVPADTRCNPL